MRVVADFREPPDIIAALASTGAIEVEIDDLDVGKYLVGPSVIVERKTGAEFLESLLDGGLGEQAFKMRAVYRRAIWIVEGPLYDGRTEVDRHLVSRTLSRLALIEHSTVLRTETRAETVDLIIAMAERLQERPYPVPLRPTKPQQPCALAEFIVCGLPGIGPIRARMLLDHFGSVRSLFQAKPEEIAAVRGLGPKTAAAIEAAVDYWYPEPPSA